jgi:hypothetical protein
VTTTGALALPSSAWGSNGPGTKHIDPLGRSWHPAYRTGSGHSSCNGQLLDPAPRPLKLQRPTVPSAIGRATQHNVAVAYRHDWHPPTRPSWIELISRQRAIPYEVPVRGIY